MVQVCSKAMTKLKKKKKMPLLNHQKNIRIKHFVKSLILIYSFYFGHWHEAFVLFSMLITVYIIEKES
jgi:4-hydroxybenzoate polyprenyltransferase